MNLIKFEHIKQKKIWGSEDWLISAHENGMSTIANGKYKGQTLKEFFQNNKELLGIESSVLEFPLLVKIIEAKDDLSVQVHPGDDYAKTHENSLGKSECWYILSKEDTDILIGQKAKNKQEMEKAIQEGRVMDTLNLFSIKQGDFFYIPSGCVHAIRSNTKVLEIQQSSDVTYRLYDYKRRDDNGNLRELHIKKSLDVIDYNFRDENKIEIVANNENYKEEILTNNDFFIVKKITIKKEYIIRDNSKYVLGILIGGKIKTENESLNIYESFMLLKNVEQKFIGKGEIIISTSK